MGCYYYICISGFLRTFNYDVVLQFHASSFYYIEYAEDNSRTCGLKNFIVMFFDRVLCKKITFALTEIIRRYIFEALCASCELKT